MLVLSRKAEERVVLKVPGLSDIIITIVKIEGKNRVRIGIEADKKVVVLREELTSEATD